MNTTDSSFNNMSDCADNLLTLKVNGGAVSKWPVGTPAVEITGVCDSTGAPYVAALYNNDTVSLNMAVEINGSLKGITAADDNGLRVLQRSMGFLLAMATHRHYPAAGLRIHQSVGSGLFCTFQSNSDEPQAQEIAAMLEKIAAEMRQLVEADLPICNRRIGYTEAMSLFKEKGLRAKYNLLRHSNAPTVKLISCNGFFDLYQGPLVNRTGLLELFELHPYESGFVLHMPGSDDVCRLPPFKPQPHLLRVYQEHIEWGRILGVQTVGQLNEAIFDKRINDVIQMSEALHNKNLARIADSIAERRSAVRLVLIAGPSSVGKTTTAKRIETHLRVNGITPLVIGTDDYFVGDERNPRDEHGKLDYEHLEALDLQVLNDDLNALMAGKSIRKRIFDFRAKSPRILDEELSLGRNGVLIMEGLHCLNPRLTDQIPMERKFRIYLSALTQLGLDENNRISTTDNRIIRRIVRDSQFRGHQAIRTLSMWSSVRRGEERWIFPFQDQSDVTFNTSLDYELAVLKPFAEQLLSEIKPDMPEYALARRLMGFLHNFHAIRADYVPGDSILREYIGDSQLQY